jgi:hypothetical protein
VAYCEQRITLLYGQEQPFTAGFCGEDDICSINSGVSVTYTNQWTINESINFGISSKRSLVPMSFVDKRDASSGIGIPSINAAINIGMSYSYSVALQYTEQVTHGRNSTDVGCGYWTFIPYIIEYDIPHLIQTVFLAWMLI